MSIRTYRVSGLGEFGLPSLSTTVEYCTDDRAVEFDAAVADLCPDCGTPAIDVTEPVGDEAKLVTRWHDSMCPSTATARMGAAHHHV